MAEFELQKTGTTTLAIKCKDGVIIGADKRATAGSQVVNRNAQKIFSFKDNIFAARAGVVSETKDVLDTIQAEIKLRELKLGRPVLVTEVASLMGKMTYQKIRTPSVFMPIAAFLVAGYDQTGGTIVEVSPDGVVQPSDTFIADGSGSVFAASVLEDSYNPNMSVSEGVALARRAFNIAMLKDTASGNGFKIYSITKNGNKLEADETVNTGIAR